MSKQAQVLEKISDLLVDDILAMSEVELHELLFAEGKTPEDEIRRIRRLILLTMDRALSQEEGECEMDEEELVV